MPTLEDLLAELAAAPPAEFTQARDALVARLKTLGQAEAATRIKAARRPTAALWAANRVAREERDAIERLIVAANRMRAAQLGHGAGAADLAGASAEQRAAIAQLIQRAAAVLAEAGLGAPHQVMARVETTLVGAAGDPDLRPALRQGRLEHELAPRGFDVFAGETLPPRPVSDGPSATDVRPSREHGGVTASQRPAVGPVPTAPLTAEPAVPPASTARRHLAEPAASAASAAAKRDRERDADLAAIKRNREREARLTAARETVSQAEARAAQQRQQLESARRRVEELSAMLRDARRHEQDEVREERRAAEALRAAREALRAAERG